VTPPLEGYGTVGAERGPVRAEIDRRVAAGLLQPDPLQRQLADRLDALGRRLRESRLPAKSSALGWLFGRAKPVEAPRGLYVHGGVGRGKSMLMDLFFELAPERLKRRTHFHAFMGEIQTRINEQRRLILAGSGEGDDPIAPVAAAVARETRLLCFDEFTVTDIADAMILSRLFEALFRHGIVLVATSNVAPRDLYRDGLNRALFLPFVDLLEARCDVFFLDAPTDYRLEGEEEDAVVIAPLGAEADRRMDAAWTRALAGQAEAPERIEHRGRALAVPRAGNGAARFPAAALLDAPLGAADFLAIAERYRTVLIDGVRVMGEGERNAAKRFILLVDTLYERRRRLVLSAERPAEALYEGQRGTERFEFARALSRLTEMGSQDYLAEARGVAPA
jgi:cell division protein ZapE